MFIAGILSILVPLWIIVGFMASGSNTDSSAPTTNLSAPVPVSVPAAPAVQATTTKSHKATPTATLFVGNPFKEVSSTNDMGDLVPLYACTSGLKSVDISIGGSGTSLYGITASATQDYDSSVSEQDSATLNIQIGPDASVPGIIIHAASQYDASDTDPDHALTKYLTSGTLSFPYQTDAYTTDPIDNVITGFTLCVQTL
jgi:hypothetical protein